MANAAAKKTVAQNERALKNLNQAMAVITFLSVLLRWWKQRGLFSLRFGFTSIFMVFSYITSFLAYSFLANSGKPPAPDSAGNLRLPTIDLSNPGMIGEWVFDILYISWSCQIGSVLLGEFVWWLYLSVPAYAAYKVGPMIFSFLRPGSSFREDQPQEEQMSKRQQKLKARQERGDPRVKSVSVKR